jgi:ATP-grasp domain
VVRPLAAASVPKTASILLLFGEDWDNAVLDRYTQSGKFTFFCEGFDLFKFPSNARLMWFNVWRFVDQMVARYGGRIDGVFSSNEQFGALAAALIAERLGLPGQSPTAILRAQHKYEARVALKKFAPELCPEFTVIPYTVTQAQARALTYPLFVKPVKATFSVLAKRCESPEELIAHLTFKPWEKHIIKRLIEPHNQALKRFPEFKTGARSLVIESPMSGHQVNVDCLLVDGEVRVLGIIDEVMYPGTMAFMRFDYPSRLPTVAQDLIRAASAKVLSGFELRDGLFNLEFFFNEETHELKLIEINPRLAAQLALFYLWVDEIDVYALGFDMVCKNFSWPEAKAGMEKRANEPKQIGAATSFVWRSFDGTSCPRLPSASDLEWLATEFPDARLEVYAKEGGSLQRDMKWLQSHRWALLNIPGASLSDTRQKYETIAARLGWPAPY